MKRAMGFVGRLVGRVEFNSFETAIWHQGYSTEGASEEEQEFFTTRLSIEEGDIILLPTMAYDMVWGVEEDFSFAVIKIGRVDENGANSRVTFKVIGHLSDQRTKGEAFTKVGDTYRVTGDLPPSFLSVSSDSLEAVRRQFPEHEVEQLSSSRSSVTSSSGSSAKKLRVGGVAAASGSGKLSAASAILFDDEDNPENTSVEQKVIVDTDGRQHVFSSKFAMQIMEAVIILT